MIRPAERFAVNIVHDEPALRLTQPTRWSSLPVLIGIAAVLGAGLGGLLPAGKDRTPRFAAIAPDAPAPVAIEPAAGPAEPLLVAKAPDERFYAPVLMDSIPVTMQIEPATPSTLLTRSDAGRLSVGGAVNELVLVEELTLGAARLGPVQLRVGSPEGGASILGADILDRLAIVSVDGSRLRLSPR